jgi:sugar lactone lactonase YvrE
MVNRTGVAHEIKPTGLEFTCVARTNAGVAESPVWSAAESCLWYVDIPGQLIHRYAPGKPLLSFPAPELVTSLAPRVRGGLIVTLQRRFAHFDPATNTFDLMPLIEREPPTNRFNDGKVDRAGRFWAGTMDMDVWYKPVGTLYRLGGGLAPAIAAEDIRCSNGVAWSPDDRTMYYAESFAHTIHAFDFDLATGAIAGRRIFAKLDPKTGAFPDGLTVDAEGYVWSAQPVFGRLVRYAPDGRIERIVETPVSSPTSLAFGGEDSATLYVTSARAGRTARELEQEPDAGGLFSCRPGVVGIPETPFAG